MAASRRDGPMKGWRCSPIPKRSSFCTSETSLRGWPAGRAFRLAELLALDAYPHASRVPAFYGQSVSVTAFLALRDDPAKFVEFLRRCEEHGHDSALRKVYAIDGVAELDRLWRDDRNASRTGYHGVRLSLDEAATERVSGAE